MKEIPEKKCGGGLMQMLKLSLSGIIIVHTFLFSLSGCMGNDEATEEKTKSVNEQEPYISQTPKFECRLCGEYSGKPFPGDATSWRWGEDNVGLISLNTFDIYRLEINRYDDQNLLLEEKTGCMTIRDHSNGDGGYIGYMSVDSDRGYSSGNVTPYQDEFVNVKKAASFLCSDCLNEVLEDNYKNDCWAVGFINFETKEIRLLRKPLIGFTLGNFYINCDFGEKEEDAKIVTRVRFLAFYCPVRYPE